VISFKLALLRLPKGNQVNILELGCGYFVATQMNLGPQKVAPHSVFFAG
jgi:hypothetical protein